MQHQKFESGRTLLETITVLVVVAILMLASIIGYSVIIHQWRKHQTVKQITELAVRYKLRPVKAEGKLVPIKTIYPEAQRSDAVTMKTPDTETGRVQLQLFEDTTSFAVVVNQVLDTSCREIIENAAYDMLVDGDQIDANTATELNAYSRDYLLNDPEGQKIAQKLCEGSDSHHMKKVGLISGEDCPSMGASYWYAGKCWNCPSSQSQDNYGNCCAKGTVDACGFCPGKCPNGGVCNTETKLCVECISDDQCAGRTDGKVKCYTPTNQCVECLNVGEQCAGSGEVNKYCMKNHTCQECDTTKHLFWNKELDICECAQPLIAVGEACFDGCCVDGASCHEGICAGCWEDYDAADPTKAGSCPAERPLCQDGLCQGCSAKPTTEGAACFTLCGCDETKGLACEEGTCQCTVDPQKTLWNTDLGRCTECTASDKTKCGEADCELTTGTCCPADKLFWDGAKCVECLTNNAEGMGACPADKPFCNNNICEECVLGTFPNNNAGRCTDCLVDKDNGTGACVASDKPWCDMADGYTCKSCTENGNKVWNEDLKSCTVCSATDQGTCTTDCKQDDGVCCPAETPYWNGTICVKCLSNNDTGNGSCEADKPWCDVDNGYVCKSCSEDNGKFWNSISKTCTSCVVNYGQGEGACTEETQPLCSANDGYICMACPPDKVWNNIVKDCTQCSETNTTACSGDTPVCKVSTGECVGCLANYGQEMLGACFNPLKPWCDFIDHTCKPCPTEALNWDDETKECFALRPMTTEDAILQLEMLIVWEVQRERQSVILQIKFVLVQLKPPIGMKQKRNVLLVWVIMVLQKELV